MVDNNFPTGPATDREEAERLVSLQQHPGYDVLLKMLKRGRKQADQNLRNPSWRAQDSKYNYGYNNGCLDQIDMILNLPENLQLQMMEVKKDD